MKSRLVDIRNLALLKLTRKYCEIILYKGCEKKMEKIKNEFNFKSSMKKFALLSLSASLLFPTISEPLAVNAFDPSNIQVKVHDPNISIKATPEDWTNENVTLTIEAEFIDKVILPNGIAVETDKPITYTVQENGMYTFIGLNEYREIMDIATFVVENIDRVAKDILITPSDDKWRNKDVEVKIEFKD